MIKGLSCVALYAEARGIARVYSDKLSFPFTDTGKGWLIFDMPEADLGCHSSDRVYHSISFYCDGIKKTVEELKSRGVKFTSDVTDEGWGLLTPFRMPGKLRWNCTAGTVDSSAAGLVDSFGHL